MEKVTEYNPYKVEEERKTAVYSKFKQNRNAALRQNHTSVAEVRQSKGTRNNLNSYLT